MGRGIPNRLREVRQLHGLTLEQVAERLNTTPTTISRYENGRVQVPDSKKAKFSELYSVTVAYLWKWDDENGGHLRVVE